MKLIEFPHEILINNAKVKIKALGPGIQAMIDDFRKKHKAWNINKDAKQLEVLKDQSSVISQHMYDYYVEDDDQAENPSLSEIIEDVKEEIQGTPAEATPAEVREQVAEVIAIQSAPNPLPVEAAPAAEPVQAPVAASPAPAPNPEPVPAVTAEVKEVPADSPVKDKNEKVLEKLFAAGTIKLSRKELGDAGFNTGSFGPLGSRGAFFKYYDLKADHMLSEQYTIIKK